jgi:hypothetical protein
MRVCLTVAYLIIGAPLLVADQPPTVKSDKAENAALKYWQAFGSLPRFDKDQEKVLAERDTIPLDQSVGKLIESCTHALVMLHRGAALRACDWGLDMAQDGIQTQMPHLNKGRELAHIGLLRARWNFEKGKYRAGIDDIGAVLALARHLAADNTLISLLVQQSIEQQAIQVTARHLPDMDTDTQKHVRAKLEALPPAATLRRAILTERTTGAEWMIKQLKARNYGVDQTIQTIVQAAGGPQGPIKQLEEFVPYYEDMARIISLPRPEFEPQWTALCKKLEGNTMARQLLPAVDKVYDADERAKTRWTMFQAALAVLRDGQSKLADYPDPAGNGPFDRREFPGGFELKSKLLHKGQPVTLMVGKEKS